MALMFPSKTRRASAVSLAALAEGAGAEPVLAHAIRSGNAKASVRTLEVVMAVNSTAEREKRNAL